MLIEREESSLRVLLQTYEYNFDYLLPPSQVYDIEIPQSEQFIPVHGGKRRRIFYKVAYRPEQLQALHEIRKKMGDMDIFQKFPDELVMKHLTTTNLDQQKALERLKKLQQLHNNPVVTTLTQSTIQKLTEGCIYTYGRDRNMKPIVIVRFDKFDTSLHMDVNFNAAYYLIIVVMKYMLVPYHAEKYIFVIDLNDMNLSKVPFFYLAEMLSRITLLFCCNVERNIVYNSGSLGWIWPMIRPLVPEHSRNTTTFVKKGRQSEIFQYIHPNQLQRRYGGQLQNLTQFWPPKNVFSPKQQAQRQIREFMSQTQFYSVQDNEQLFSETKSTLCNCEQCIIY